MAFNLQDYETVEERLEKFWAKYPDGRIDTILVSSTDKRFIVQAWAYKTFADAVPFTSGLAFEDIADRGVNATSALENAETSAIGRCLASGGFAAKGKRPSQTEMSKVQNFERVKPQGSKILVENPEDAWTVKTTSEPEKVDIAEAFGATETVPHCKHGEMMRKEGTTKAGKAYMGFVCVGYLQTGGDPKCDAIWYELTPSGKWKPQEKK